jgi:hypothetical protein
MKKNPSVAKKIASLTAGTVLAASLYANAVYQPRNQSALESALNNELQAVVAGEAGVQAIGDGFVVTERVASSSPVVEDQLIQQIAALEVEMAANSAEVQEQIAAAYDSKQTVRVAQTTKKKDTGTGSTVSDSQIRAAAQVISRISGVPVGQTIGTLAAIISNPFVAAAVVELAAATSQPGGVAAAASNSGGLSAAAQTLIATTGSTSNDGVAAAVTAAATSNTGSTTVGGGQTSASP